MSLAGPYGEAACKWCSTLQDLDPFGFFVWHNVPRHTPGPAECPGSRQAPEIMPKELEALAFSSESVIRQCPSCKQDVTVTTIGQARALWRFDSHYRSGIKWCAGSGALIDCKPDEGETVEPGETWLTEPF